MQTMINRTSQEDERKVKKKGRKNKHRGQCTAWKWVMHRVNACVKSVQFLPKTNFYFLPIRMMLTIHSTHKYIYEWYTEHLNLGDIQFFSLLLLFILSIHSLYSVLGRCLSVEWWRKKNFLFVVFRLFFFIFNRVMHRTQILRICVYRL